MENSKKRPYRFHKGKILQTKRRSYDLPPYESLTELESVIRGGPDIFKKSVDLKRLGRGDHHHVKGARWTVEEVALLEWERREALRREEAEREAEREEAERKREEAVGRCLQEDAA
jgi:hypothetical protein